MWTGARSEPVFEIRLDDVTDVRIEHRRETLDVTSRFDPAPQYIQGRSEYFVDVETVQAPAPPTAWRVRLGEWSLVMCAMNVSADIGDVMRTTYQLRASEAPPQSFLDAIAQGTRATRGSRLRRRGQQGGTAVVPSPLAQPKAPKPPAPRGARVYDLDEDA